MSFTSPASLFAQYRPVQRNDPAHVPMDVVHRQLTGRPNTPPLSRRAVAQRARRQKERVGRESAREEVQRKRRIIQDKINQTNDENLFTSLPDNFAPLRQTPGRRAVAQRARRERERCVRPSTVVDDVDHRRKRQRTTVFSSPTNEYDNILAATLRPSSELDDGNRHPPPRIDATICRQPSPPQPPHALRRRGKRERDRDENEQSPRKRRRKERSSPSCVDSSANSAFPSARSLAQRNRRQRERESRQVNGQHDTRAVAQSRRRARERLTRSTGQPLARRPYLEPIAPQSFGSMTLTCVHCHALHWLDERVKNSSKSHPEFARCCHHGKVSLPKLPQPPDRLRNLYTSEDDNAKHFRDRIRQYNSALAFASFTAKEKTDYFTGEPVQNVNADGRGPWVWKSGYTIYHRVGTLFPDAQDNARYAQLYFYDPDEALDIRMRRNDKLNRDTMKYLENFLLASNHYTHVFFHAKEVLDRNPSRDLGIHIIADSSTDPRRYNVPVVNEVAVVLPGDQSHAVTPRDIVLHLRDGDLQFIHDHHPAYIPLHYVLLFPFGTPGWTYGLHLRNGMRDHTEDEDNDDGVTVGNGNEKDISQAMFYSYRLHTRIDQFPIIHYARHLFQQYVCDVWVSTDQNRLRWVENHQPQLRAALYSGLEDAVEHGDDDVELRDLGRRIVLPSSYTGGPRYMNQRFQDAIALARYNHGFDLFVTFTCNARWPEIDSALLSSQSASDRPDLTVRVFNMYKTALVNELTHNHILGHATGHVFTIEFQKRGLPHMHLLLSLSPNARLDTPERVDSVIRATWPDPVHEPHLFEIVRRCMVHGPCGSANRSASCMRNGICSKGFPKPFQSETVLNRDGYPLYARPDDGRAYNVRGFLADNRWIVPYNPYILARYDAHINIECVMSLAAAKYITKYTHKGPDRATVELQQRNEVSEFVDTRYIAAAEAAWRLFEIPIHHQSPSVISLQVHLPGHHFVVFNPNEPLDVVTARAEQEKTMLTAFFDINRRDSFAHQFTYPELPLHFVWDRQKKLWRRRIRGGSIGRMYFVSPTAGERFYLRALLTTVKGPTSWENLRSFDGISHNTFHAACLARGLLENDDEWRQCLREASLTHLGNSLRDLFCLLLIHCTPSQPDVLWTEFRDNICDDLLRRIQRLRPAHGPVPLSDIYDFGLFLIDKTLRQQGSSLSTFPSMPLPRQNWDELHANPYIIAQLAYDTAKERSLAETSEKKLNHEQRAAFDQIYTSTSQSAGRIFFLHGPGGTGKTFVYNTLCHRIRANSWIVLCVASSGIASLLLPGGHTAHSTFAIPVQSLSEDSSCHIDKNSQRAQMLREVRLLIWDEAVTQHRFAIEAVNRLLQDIRSSSQLFGGLTVVFGGDFQQTLPVVKHGSRPAVVQATIQQSPIWDAVSVIHLRQNMRVLSDPQSLSFSNWLLDIGHGRSPNDGLRSSSVPLSTSMTRESETALIENVYSSLHGLSSPPSPNYFKQRTILTALNEDVRALNDRILDRLPGEERTYTSADTYSFDSPGTQELNDLPLELLHSLNASGLPVAHLRLKNGCPIILLRNLDTNRGLCNGTRATILRMSNRVLEVRLLTGDRSGETALIPRITLSPSDSDVEYSIKLKRRQFPVQVALAMTINKSQGQTLDHIGLDLRKPVFAHGQLYVAFSRATSPQHVTVLLPELECEATNVVYYEVLL